MPLFFLVRKVSGARMFQKIKLSERVYYHLNRSLWWQSLGLLWWYVVVQCFDVN